MAISYAGVSLAACSDALADIIQAEIDPADVYEAQAPDWPGQRRQHWPFPWRQNLRPILIGRLFWPRDAARWAVGHFLATDAQLAKIRPQIYGKANTDYNALPLVINDGRTDYEISTDLFLLPPRPLSQIEGLNGLHLLTLVDERYFWWERAVNVIVTEGSTTWLEMYEAIATALGIDLTVDTIAAAYLKPPGSLTAYHEPLPMLLDVVCRCVGQRFVRRLDGKCFTQNPTTAKAAQDAQLADWARLKGGLFALEAGEDPCDLNALVPENVIVVFPAASSGSLQDVPQASGVSLASLALAEYAGATGHLGAKIYHDSTIYDLGLGNIAEMSALTVQIGTDYYRWRLGRQDQKYLGIIPYSVNPDEPYDGLSDSIEWSSREADVSTRVQRGQWDDRIETLLHVGSLGSVTTSFPGTVTFPGTIVLPNGSTSYDDGIEYYGPHFQGLYTSGATVAFSAGVTFKNNAFNSMSAGYTAMYSTGAMVTLQAGVTVVNNAFNSIGPNYTAIYTAGALIAFSAGVTVQNSATNFYGPFYKGLYTSGANIAYSVGVTIQNNAIEFYGSTYQGFYTSGVTLAYSVGVQVTNNAYNFMALGFTANYTSGAQVTYQTGVTILNNAINTMCSTYRVVYQSGATIRFDEGVQVSNNGKNIMSSGYTGSYMTGATVDFQEGVVVTNNATNSMGSSYRAAYSTGAQVVLLQGVTVANSAAETFGSPYRGLYTSGAALTIASGASVTFSAGAGLTLQDPLSLANGGTGSKLTDPAANKILAWDDTDNTISFWTLGTGLSYDHSTHTLSATGGGSGSPGGANTNVQYNDSSAFGGDANFVWDKTGMVLTVSATGPYVVTVGSGGVVATDASSNSVEIANGARALQVNSGLSYWLDDCDFRFGTGGGTVFGTATGQKLAFWAATPVAQHAAIADCDITTVVAQFNTWLAWARSLGLIAT